MNEEVDVGFLYVHKPSSAHDDLRYNDLEIVYPFVTDS